MISQKHGGHAFHIFRKNEDVDSHVYKHNIFQDVPKCILDLFKVSWSLQRQIKVVFGAGDGLKHYEIMKFGFSGL